MLYIILMCISHFMFYANNLLLDVCFIFILDYGNDVRQKANLNDSFYSSSKWVVSSGDNSQHQQYMWPRNC